MKVGTDLKEMFQAIYPKSLPGDVFQSGNAGLALAGHYIAEAIKAYAQTQAATHLTFQKAQQEDQSSKLQAKIEDLQIQLTIAQSSLRALETRHHEMIAQANDQAPRVTIGDEHPVTFQGKLEETPVAPTQGLIP